MKSIKKLVNILLLTTIIAISMIGAIQDPFNQELSNSGSKKQETNHDVYGQYDWIYIEHSGWVEAYQDPGIYPLLEWTPYLDEGYTPLEWRLTWIVRG